jgi:hypothetical protein
MTASLTHWLPYIGFWALVSLVFAAFAVYVYAALPLFRRTSAVPAPEPVSVPLPPTNPRVAA